jgi:hypothetical protein
MIYSERKAAIIDIDRATEFTGDDVDRYSSLVKFDKPYERLIITIPEITSAALNVYVAASDSVAAVPVPVHYRQTTDNATAVWATTASTGKIQITCDVGLAQFVRLYLGANQTADRTLYIVGVRS